jgi:hypothetical protein
MQNLELYTGVLTTNGTECLCLLSELKTQIGYGAKELEAEKTKELKDAIVKQNTVEDVNIIDVEAKTVKAKTKAE